MPQRRIGRLSTIILRARAPAHIGWQNYIVQDSPFTMLAELPLNYLDNQECTDFITAIPTVFDETSIMDGKMGEYIVDLKEER